ncbi:MAG TPA: SRPBCC family protein [Acidimicrobiales bacterium]|nr:SRPBCC family protein [Acidimicrobiales bacterium]
MGEQVEVSVHVDATPEQVYELVGDLPRMGEWSPECVRCTWTDGATAATPGARFKGHNRRGVRRWTTKGTVVTAQPGRELSFDVHSVFDLPVSRWTYRITPHPEGGCDVTEAWEDRRGRVMKLLGNLVSGVSNRAEHNTDGMRRTLDRIKATAEGART